MSSNPQLYRILSGQKTHHEFCHPENLITTLIAAQQTHHKSLLSNWGTLIIVPPLGFTAMEAIYVFLKSYR